MKEHKAFGWQDCLLVVVNDGEDFELMTAVGKYPNDRPAIRYHDAESWEPIFTLTVNIPEVELGDDEIIVKTWGANKKYTDQLRDAACLEDTGRRVNTGLVEAEIWRVLD